MQSRFWRTIFPLYKYLLVVLAFSYSLPVKAQYFGRNKVNYRRFEFQVLQSPHFEIYHYLNNVASRNRIAQASEQWYRIHQTIFKDSFELRNPLLIYNTHAEFQQTRAIEGQIGVATGGVTEALKNRVVMPFMESNAQTDHVLGHELVHAFQYHLIQDTLTLNAVNNIPLWMVEGLAEYMSTGPIDAHTAIWLRNGVATNKLPTLKDLTNRPDEYFPYRWGQAFWTYTTGVYGDSIIRRLFIQTAKSGYEQAIKNLFKIDEKEFSKRWKTAITNAYAPLLANTQAPPGNELIQKKNAGELNIVPALSPDGKRIAFWTEKSLFNIDLFVADAETGKNLKRITTNTFGSHIDEYSSYESSVAWSPDSRQIAFVAFAKGRNSLVIADVSSGKMVREIFVPGVSAISNPTWSPDGNTIVMTGLVEGQGDLYAYDLKASKVRQLTKDSYSDMQPSYSPDGKWIVFATDAQSIGDKYLQHRFWHNLALLNVQTGAVTNLDIFNGANNLNPIFGADNNIIYFLSDRDGFRNMYSYNLATHQLLQRTNLFTGITGITMFSPAISAARQVDRITYNHYTGDNYNIFSVRSSDLVSIDVNAGDVDSTAATLPPFNRVGTDIVKNNIENTPFGLVDVRSLDQVPFKPKFQLDYVGSTGVGVTTGRFGGGLAGGVNGIFSDILGNNQLYGAISLNGEIYDVAAQFAYLNRTSRIQWGISISHIPYLSGGQTVFLDTITNHSNDTVSVYNYALDLLRTFEDQVLAFAIHPFSQTSRLEVGASFARYYYRLDRYSDFYDAATGAYVGNDKERLETPSGFNLAQGYFAFVGDNANFGVAAPLTGHRFRVELAQYLGEVTQSNLTADYRRYFRLAPITLATRNMYIGRFGRDAASGIIPPLYLGYANLIHGYNALDFTDQNANVNKQPLSINDLIGSQLYVANAELRLPFTGPERLARIKSRFFLSDLNLFTDGGVAWGNYEGFYNSTGGRDFADSKIILSSGVSLRVNVLGYLVLEPFFAIPWQNGGFKNGNFGLNLLPGW